MTNTNKKELISSIQKGDSILIDYTKELLKFEDEEDLTEEQTKKMTLVLEVNEDSFKLKDSSSPYPFEMTRKYLLKSELELEIIEEC